MTANGMLASNQTARLPCIQKFKNSSIPQSIVNVMGRTKNFGSGTSFSPEKETNRPNPIAADAIAASQTAIGANRPILATGLVDDIGHSLAGRGVEGVRQTGRDQDEIARM